MTEIVIRFFVGGVAVSLFALVGDVLKPKSFAGLFGAAPSIVLADRGITGEFVRSFLELKRRKSSDL